MHLVGHSFLGFYATKQPHFVIEFFKKELILESYGPKGISSPTWPPRGDPLGGVKLGPPRGDPFETPHLINGGTQKFYFFKIIHFHVYNVKFHDSDKNAI